MAEGREIKEMLERMTMELANFLVRQNQIEDQHEKSFAELKEALEAVKRGDKGKAIEESKGNGEMYTPSVQPMAWVSATHTEGTPTMVTLGSAGHIGPRTLAPYLMPSGAPNQMHYGGFHGQTSTGFVKDYQNEFDKIMTRLTILPEYAISSFITGLRPEIGLTVKNHMPFSLPQAYQLARNTEAQVQAQLKLTRFPPSASGSQYKNNSYSSFSRGVRSKNDYNQDKKETSLSLNKNNNKILSSTEINERRQKGLCFFCDEKFFPGHKCGGSKSLYLLEVEDEREDQE
ncbi:hypothetical protein KY285_020642 [Solanum tuberosum]|nr:hypothetical protein KY285_020642 [Solanum tuberosum]